jgi:hypothetical protein
MVSMISRRLAENPLSDSPEPIGFTVGTCGGRRSIERENIHYAATLDNLINLASKDCSRRKKPKHLALVQEPQESAAKREEARQVLPRVVSVHDSRKGSGSLITVILSTGDAVVSGVHSRTTESVHMAVGLATIEAFRRIAPNFEVAIEEVVHEEGPGGERYVTVAGHATRGGVEVAVSGVRMVVGDVNVAVAEATVEACYARIE